MEEIEVDDEVLAALKGRAEPFVDTTPNRVLRRLLGLDGEPSPDAGAGRNGTSPAGAAGLHLADGAASGGRRPEQRLPRGVLLPESEYRMPILQVLYERGGAAPAGAVIDEVGRRLGDRFSEEDHEYLSSGGIRWRKRAQFVRLQLIEEGLLDGSTWGIWALTEAGRQAVRRR